MKKKKFDVTFAAFDSAFEEMFAEIMDDHYSREGKGRSYKEFLITNEQLVKRGFGLTESLMCNVIVASLLERFLSGTRINDLATHLEHKKSCEFETSEGTYTVTIQPFSVERESLFVPNSH
jgi:hypothetical protein